MMSYVIILFVIFHSYDHDISRNIPSGQRLQQTMENQHFLICFDGTAHNFDWTIFNSYVKLPEGNPDIWKVPTSTPTTYNYYMV